MKKKVNFCVCVPKCSGILKFNLRFAIMRFIKLNLYEVFSKISKLESFSMVESFGQLAWLLFITLNPQLISDPAKTLTR